MAKDTGKLDLKKVKVVRSHITNTIYIVRFGVKENEALDKRDATAEVMAAVVEHVLNVGPSGAFPASGGIVVSFGKKRFKIVVTALKEGKL